MGAKYYNSLEDKNAQKIIKSLTKTKVLTASDNVESILGEAILWGVGNCLVATDKELVFFQNNPNLQKARYPYKGISSVAVEQKGIGTPKLILTIGVKNIVLNLIGGQNDIQEMYSFIESKL
ncbi:MAG TPA: PH domain-containing protein [Bacteroidales bacterium]|nr:PH domain-containing protein [Bacteroidales bacterium]